MKYPQTIIQTEITTQVLNRSDAAIKITGIVYTLNSDTIAEIPLKKNDLKTFKRSITIDKKMAYSNPYWLKSVHDEGFFTVKDPIMLLQPENSAAISVLFKVNIDGIDLQTSSRLQKCGSY